MAENFEKYYNCLRHLAFPSQATIGRKYPLIEEEARYDRVNPYLRDESAILESKALRRLGSKTQVFTDPKNPHVRHRSDHTHEATSAAIWIATLTGLNVELCRDIALGHDLGHSPYGHLGEGVISEITGKEFRHEIFGVVVAQQIERKGNGLNLTYEVLAGMRWHSGISEIPPDLQLPLECRIGNFADKISYIFADVNDAQRLESPESAKAEQKAKFFGHSHRERTQRCIKALVEESADVGTLSFSKSEIAQAFLELRKWMYKEIYEQLNNIRLSLRSALYDVYGLLSRLSYFEGCDPALLLALMTDREVDDLIATTRNKRYLKFEEIAHLGIVEIAPFLKGKKIDFTQIDLDPAHFRRDFAEKLAVPLEIERKFLVKIFPENLDQYPSIEMLQGYLEINNDGTEVRIRKEGKRYFLVRKAGKGKTREESLPKEISRQEFDNLWPKIIGQGLKKTRYFIDKIELDIYQEQLQGLVVAEREFESEEESVKFTPPEWFGEEVTENERYKNKNLAQFGLK